MRAVLFDGAMNRLVDDPTVRDPGPGEVLVRIHATGLCQSDIAVMNGTIPFPAPVVLGHEGAGVVEAVGVGVDSPRVGDHVVLSTLANCGRCPSCAAGRPTLCPESFGRVDTPFTHDGTAINNFAATSTFAELTVVKAIQATMFPSDIPFTVASLLGCCVLTGVGAAFHRAQVQPGDTVAVIGCGGVGLNAIQGARLAGASHIIALDLNPAKAATALRFGATAFIDAAVDDVAARVRDIVDRGVTHVFDCVGYQPTLQIALEIGAPGGTVTILGVPKRGTEYAIPSDALFLNRTIMGCRYGDSQPARDIPRYVDLYRSGRLLLDELVSEVYPFDDFNELLESARGGRLDRGVLTF